MLRVRQPFHYKDPDPGNVFIYRNFNTAVQRQQPQGSAQIDPRFKQDLLFAYTPWSGVLSPEGSKTAYTGSAPPVAYSDKGVYGDFNGSSHGINITGTNTGFPNGMSFLVIASRDASTGVQTVFGNTNSYPNGGLELALYNTFGTPAAQITGGYNAGTGGNEFQNWFINGTQKLLGVPYTTTVNTFYCMAGSTPALPGNTNNIAIGAFGNGVYRGQVNVPLVIMWSRQLPAELLRQLSINPWQVFRNTQPRYTVAPVVNETTRMLGALRRNTVPNKTLDRYQAPRINRQNPLTNRLVGLGLGGRPNAYQVTFVDGNTGAVSMAAHGNPAANANNIVGFDLKYGYGLKVIDSVPWGSAGQLGATFTSAGRDTINTEGNTILYIGLVNDAQTNNGQYMLFRFANSGAYQQQGFALLNNYGNVRNKLVTSVYTTGGTYLYSPTVDFPVNRAVCIVATHHKSKGQKLYFDGKLVAEQNTTVDVDLNHAGFINQLYLDTGNNGTSFILAGWDRVLSEQEIQQIYENPHQLYQVPHQNYLFASYPYEPEAAITSYVTRSLRTKKTNIQPNSLKVDRSNYFGRDSTFLWSAANPMHDATGNFLATGIVNTFLVSVATITSQPPVITHTSQGSIYTSTETPIGSGTGGGIVFSAIPATNAFRTPGNNWTLAILAKYVSTTQNLRVVTVNNLAQTVHHLYGVGIGGNPWFRSSNSFTQTPNTVATSTTPYTLNKVHLTVWVVRTDGTDIYVDGNLVATTTNNHSDLMQVARLAITTQGIQPMLVSSFDKALTQDEVKLLGTNPWQLYDTKQPYYLYKQPPSEFETNNVGSIGTVSYKKAKSSQPSGNIVTINRNNTISRGLVGAFIPGIPVNIVDNKPVQQTLSGVYTETIISHRGSRGRVISSGAYSYLNTDTNAQRIFDLNQGTVFAIVVQDSKENGVYGFQRRNNSGEAAWGVGLWGGSANGPEMRFGSFRYFPGGNFNGDSNYSLSPHAICITADGTTARGYADGIEFTSGAYTPPTYDSFYDQRRVFFGPFIGSSNTSIRPFVGLFWNRALSAEEVRSISENPYQLFQEERRYYTYSPPVPPNPYVLRIPHIKQISQPQSQGTSNIDWGNPLSRGLLMSTTPLAQYNTNNLLPSVQGSVITTQYTPTGAVWRGAAASAATNYIRIERGPLTYTTAVTFEVLFKLNSANQTGGQATTSGIISQWQYVGGADARGPVLQMNHQFGGVGRLQFSVPVGASTIRTVTQPSPWLNPGSVYHVVATFAPTGPTSATLNIYINGQLNVTDNPFTGTFVNDSNNFVSLMSHYVDNNPSPNVSADIDLYLARIYNTAKTDVEVRELYKNPWQIYQTPKPTFAITQQTNPLEVGTFLPQKWRQQPQGPSTIDYGSPFSTKLSTVIVPSITWPIRDLITGAREDSYTRLYPMDLQRGYLGAYYGDPIGGGWAQVENITGITANYPALTVLSIYSQPDTTTSGRIFSAGHSGTYNLGFWKNDNGTIGLTPQTNSSYLPHPSPALQINRIYALCAVQRFATQYRALYIDGRLISTRNDFTNHFANAYTFAGTSAGPGVNRRMRLFGSFVWTRELSSTEIYEISQNPWQIFKRPTKRIAYFSGNSVAPTIPVTTGSWFLIM